MPLHDKDEDRALDELAAELHWPAIRSSLLRPGSLHHVTRRGLAPAPPRLRREATSAVDPPQPPTRQAHPYPGASRASEEPQLHVSTLRNSAGKPPSRPREVWIGCSPCRLPQSLTPRMHKAIMLESRDLYRHGRRHYAGQ